MAQRTRKVNYCYLKVPSRAGQGAKILSEIKNAGINLLAFSGFPVQGGKSQIDLVADNMSAIRRVANKNGWRMSKTKRAFLVQGTDEVGAVQKNLQRLAKDGISITAVDAVAAGTGRYGMIFWVKPKDYGRAARILNAK